MSKIEKLIAKIENYKSGNKIEFGLTDTLVTC